VNIQDALLGLLPPVAYDRNAAGVGQEAAAAAAPLADIERSASDLRREHDPAASVAALLDWERNYALPDVCSGGTSQTIEQRRLALMQRIRGRGNLSRAFMISLAASVGYPGATITELGPFTCVDPCDGELMGFEWVGVWRMNLLQQTSTIEATCESLCDAPLRSFGNNALECLINRRKPAHTVAMFAYAP
jgi:uncharacterized protein YmfQ (DUF2313 family)